MPRVAACWAASSGSVPKLLAPSVRATMMSGTYAPGVTGGGSTPGRPSPVLAWTDGSTSEMASMAARIPLPIAVRRPVVRLRSAASSAVLSLVGAWTTWAKPLNATIPIWVLEPWCSMNVAAAASAACEPVRGDVVRAHAARDIDDQHDGGLVGRDAGDGDRPADAEGEGCEGQREQCERQVPPPARRPRLGGMDERQARIADAPRPAPAQAPDVDARRAAGRWRGAAAGPATGRSWQSSQPGQ